MMILQQLPFRGQYFKKQHMFEYFLYLHVSGVELLSFSLHFY